MAVVVEDGSVVSGANSYISEDTADTYFADRGEPSEWTGATSAQRETALLYSTQWLDANMNWVSKKLDPANQELEWPRAEFAGTDGKNYGGSAIPQALINATAEMALRFLKADFTQTDERGSLISKERIGGSEISYNKTQSVNNFSYVTLLLRYLGVPRKAAIKLRRA